jgi:hypothetical protein
MAAPKALPQLFALAILILQTPTLGADDQVYRAVFVDAGGQLHIVLSSGKQILPEKIEGQVSFDSPLISPDGHTVGWLIMYPYPVPPGSDWHPKPIPGGLALYRANHVIHTFTTQQAFEDWQFRDEGKNVAYATGPAHGEVGLECVLRDVESGRIVDKWVMPDGEPPSCTRDLRY